MFIDVVSSLNDCIDSYVYLIVMYMYYCFYSPRKIFRFYNVGLGCNIFYLLNHIKNL